MTRPPLGGGPETRGRGPGRALAWAGDLGRILAFAALVMLLGSALGGVWNALPLPAGREWLFAGSVVTAAAALAAGALLIRLADGRPAAALGVALSRDALLHAGLGLAIGAGALLLAVLALLVTGSLRFTAQPGAPGDWLAAVVTQGGVFAVAAFAEEAMFRGYAFQVLVRSTGPVAATALSSVLFAVAHAANPEVGRFALLNIFLAGVLLAVAYLRTLSLWFATAVHLGWNWTMATLIDLPVSGITIYDTPGYDTVVSGPEWWTGGAFGPEGGLVGTLAFAGALLVVLRMRGVGPDRGVVAAGPLPLDRKGSTE